MTIRSPLLRGDDTHVLALRLRALSQAARSSHFDLVRGTKAWRSLAFRKMPNSSSKQESHASAYNLGS